MGVRITGCRLAVPPGVEDNAVIGARTGQTPEWIAQTTGVHRRHVASEDTDPATLAVEVAQQVIAETGRPDLLIYAGAIPRQTLPEDSTQVLRLLKLDGVPGFSVNASCLSFLVAMRTAQSMIESGPFQRVLVCCAELASRGRNFDQPESAGLLGDGAAAAMLESSPGDSGLRHWAMQTWPEGSRLTQVRAGGILHPFANENGTTHLFDMDGPGLLRFTVPRMRRFLADFFESAQVKPEDIDLVIPHQPSGRGVDSLQTFGFNKDQVVNIVGNYGNCVAASLPMALATALQDGRIQSGDRVLFVGTAAGVSLAAGLFQW